MDVAKNFSKGTLAASIDETDLSLDVESGQGARFPGAPFNIVTWNSTDYPDPADAFHAGKAEIIRVNTKSTDTFSDLVRGQEGTSAIPHDSSGKTYTIICPLTAKVINDLGTIILIGLDSFTGTIAAFDATGMSVEKDTGITIIGGVLTPFPPGGSP